MPEDRTEDYVRDRLGLIETREFLAKDRLHPWVVGTLESLRAHRLHLVTLRNNRANLLWQLEALGVDRYFAGIHSRDGNDGTWQAKRQLALAVAIPPGAEVVFVGDTEADILAARSLAYLSVAVESGIRTRGLLEASEPDRIIAHIGQLQGGAQQLTARRPE